MGLWKDPLGLVIESALPRAIGPDHASESAQPYLNVLDLSFGVDQRRPSVLARRKIRGLIRSTSLGQP